MIQVKFLEQWRDILQSEKTKEEDHFLDGQLSTLDVIISINNKNNPNFKTLKSFLKAYTKKLESQRAKSSV